MSATAYPLQWPLGWRRTERRREARFGKSARGGGPVNPYVAARPLTITEAHDRLSDELVKMAVDLRTVVISTNVAQTMSGRPRSGQRKPHDPGAAVYWVDTFNGKPRVMAIDQYDRVEDNIAALAATVAAMRAIERHGGAVILERAFTGFEALPAPRTAREWWEVLGVPRSADRSAVRAAYRALASVHHPDRAAGSHEAMAELNAAHEKAMLECAGA